MGERGLESAKGDLQIFRIEVVGADPLQEQSSLVEALGDDGVELSREEKDLTIDPRVGRLRNDDVVGPLGSGEIVPRIAYGQFHPFIAEGVPVLQLEEPRRLDDRRVQLEHVDPLHRRKTLDRGQRDPAAEPDDRHVLRVRVHQAGDVPQEELGRDVQARSGIDFAVDHEHLDWPLFLHDDGAVQPEVGERDSGGCSLARESLSVVARGLEPPMLVVDAEAVGIDLRVEQKRRSKNHDGEGAAVGDSAASAGGKKDRR